MSLIKPEKNILFLTNLHLWSLDEGKGGRAFYNTVPGYKSAGWNIWFISTGGGIPDNLIDKNNIYENSYPKLDKLWRSKYRLISILARYIKLILLNSFYFKYGSKILNTHKGKNFIIYAYEVDGVFVGKKLSKKYNHALVTRFQGTKHNKTSFTIFNKIRYAPYLSALSTNADLCIMTNDGTQGLKTLERFGNKSEQIVFWRNGVARVSSEVLSIRNDLRLKFGYDGNFIFLAVSRLVGWKKVDRAINAFASICNQRLNARLVILGDGDAKAELVQLTETLGISDKVKFMGAVQQVEVAHYMVAADVFLSFYNLSNVGNPLMEAMMCGKPIITLDVGDTRELIKHDFNGILLQMNQISDIPSYLIKLTDDKSLYSRLSDAAFETALDEFWSWEERIEAELNLVGNLHMTNRH